MQKERLRLCFFAGLTASLACSGSIGSEPTGTSKGDPDAEDGVIPPPPGEDSLGRIPDEPLVCSDPNRLNVEQSAFSRLTNNEYIRSLRDLAAPIELDVGLGLALPKEPSDEKGYTNNFEFQNVVEQGIEQYEATGRTVGKKIVEGLANLKIAACSTVDAASEQSACAAAFVESFGRRAFRRPLSAEEVDGLKSFYQGAADKWGFKDALTMVASAILTSPQFLYRIEIGTEDERGLRLTGYETATRLSYLVWGSTPDEALLAAAQDGELDTRAGLRAQVDRLLVSPRALNGLGDFSERWLTLGRLRESASAGRKDKTLFPGYTDAVYRANIEGLDRFVQESLFGKNGGVKTLLSSTKAWVNEDSDALYDLDVSGKELREVDLDPARRRGLLTQAGLLAGFAHETVQAPVQRGVFLLEHLLCSPPPPPPPNVPSAPPTTTGAAQTTRQKFIEIHESQANCKGCHQRIDAAGFAFENYGAIGQWQEQEIVGEKRVMLPIDGSGALIDTYDADGKFNNAVELIDRLSSSKQAMQCFANNFFHYAMARKTVEADGCALAQLGDEVIANDGSFRSLVMALVGTNQFRYRAPIANPGEITP